MTPGFPLALQIPSDADDQVIPCPKDVETETDGETCDAPPTHLCDLPLELLSQICESSLNLEVCLVSKDLRDACDSRCMARTVATLAKPNWFNKLLTIGLLKDGLEVVHTLDLYGHNIGNQGCVALAEALKTNRTVHTLHLGGNYINDQGCVAEALKKNKH